MDNNANYNLINAMERLKQTGTDVDQNWFLQNLVNCRFVVPVAVDAVPDENGKLPDDVNVKYFSIKNTDDQIFLVVFTNTDYFQEWQPDISKYHVLYDYDQVEKMVTRDGSGFAGFLIDPNYGNVAVENHTLNKISKAMPTELRVKAERIITENNIGLLPVENPSEKLVEALRNFMAGYRSVNEAYLMQTIRQGEEEPTLIIVLDFLGSASRVFEDVARVAQDNMEKAQAIGIMPAYDKVAKKYIENVEPLFTRKNANNI